MPKLDFLKTKYDVGVINFNTYLNYKKIKNKDWIKSIIVFVFPYQNTNIYGKYITAKFAYGKDYHQVVNEKITEVAEELGLNRYEVMVDVSYLDEKLCAYLAGLGTYGKNNLLITPKYGTYVVIGEIVTDEVFEKYDEPIESLCKDCDICVTKCPTHALDNGFDRKSCLSYLTQTTSKNFETYENIKNICFGCDICQDVCIHNKKKDYQYINEFNFNEKSQIDILKLKAIDENTYQNFYFDKTFNWIGYLKMLRNILVLEVNNKNISYEELEYFQNKHQDCSWFYNHLEYLKGKVKDGTK